MARVAEAWYPRCIGESFFVPSKLLPKLWETGMISPNSVTIKKWQFGMENNRKICSKPFPGGESWFFQKKSRSWIQRCLNLCIYCIFQNIESVGDANVWNCLELWSYFLGVFLDLKWVAHDYVDISKKWCHVVGIGDNMSGLLNPWPRSALTVALQTILVQRTEFAIPVSRLQWKWKKVSQRTCRNFESFCIAEW